MSPEKSSGTSLINARNLLIGGGILAIVGIAGVAMAIGGGRGSVMESSAAVGFSDTSSKTAQTAPNVKADYHPTPDKAGNTVAPKTLESKNTGATDNTMVASVKEGGKAKVAKDENPLNVIAYGAPSAPITIIEYGSFSCSHCAEFEKNEFPKIKEAYIDKGLARLVYRPFSRNSADVLAGLLVSCLQPERRTPMIEFLFRQQNSWIPWDAPADEQQTQITHNLKAYGRNAGLTEPVVDQCLKDTKNQAWLQSILAQANKDGVDGTPTFFINGKKYSNMPWNEWKSTLNALLPKTD